MIPYWKGDLIESIESITEISVLIKWFNTDSVIKCNLSIMSHQRKRQRSSIWILPLMPTMCWSSNRIRDYDTWLEQRDHLNGLYIQTLASNEWFKSIGIYVSTSSVNQTCGIQLIHKLKLIIGILSYDISGRKNWNIYDQLNSLIRLSKTTLPIYLKQLEGIWIDIRIFKSNHHSYSYS